MDMRRIKIGSGDNVERGWLIISGGTIRGILSYDQRLCTRLKLIYAHDRGIQPCGSFHLLFDSIELAADWIESRLETINATHAPEDIDLIKYLNRFGISHLLE